MAGGTFLFLGTGGSAGVPMIGCKCLVCKSKDPHNKRMRPSALIDVKGKRLVIDTGPDFRSQALIYKIDHLDGVLLSHTHFDHVGGLDELRTYYLLHKLILPILVSIETLDSLKKRYDYLFKEKSWGISLAAQLHFQVLENDHGKTSFCGIPLSYVSYEQGGTKVNGYRFGNFAYVSDIKKYPDSIYDDLNGVKTLVVSALKEEESQMHFSLDEAVSFGRRVGAKRTYFTHIGHEVDHERTNAKLPSGFKLAHDGLKLEFDDGNGN